MRIADTFLGQGVLREAPDGYVLTERGCTSLRSVGVEIPVASGSGSYVPRHPDWSEKSHHMAGVLATSLTRLLLDRGCIKPVGSSRAVRVTDPGKFIQIRSLKSTPDVGLSAGHWVRVWISLVEHCP